MRALAYAALASLAAPALACDYPDQGNLPLRRAVSRVQLLPDVAEWSRERIRKSETVQYRLLLDRPVQVKGRCHWTVEALAEGNVWRRFYVSPDGKSVLPAQ